MAITTHSARITGPVQYLEANGKTHHIPLGPCLVEHVDDQSIDIVWGASGQRSAVLPTKEVRTAQERGNLILLD